MERKVLYVEWEDSYTTNPGWRDLDIDEIEPLILKQVGFLLKENDTHLVLYTQLNEDMERCSEYSVIPQSLIRKKEVIFSFSSLQE